MTATPDAGAAAPGDPHPMPSTEPHLVTLEPAVALAIEGRGAPGQPAFVEAVGTLFGVMGVLRQIAAEQGSTIAPEPLEGLWEVADDRSPLEVPRDEWPWEVLVQIPKATPDGWIAQATSAVGAAGKVRRIALDEGLCVQALHEGTYAVAAWGEPRRPPARGGL